MGKKRRLNSAKLKFNAKHKTHPRARLLAKNEQPVADKETLQDSTAPEDVLLTQNTTPEVVLQPKDTTKAVKAKSAAPNVAKTRTSTKKKTPTRRKRTTKKKTTSAVA